MRNPRIMIYLWREILFLDSRRTDASSSATFKAAMSEPLLARKNSRIFMYQDFSANTDEHQYQCPWQESARILFRNKHTFSPILFPSRSLGILINIIQTQTQ
jgi:hypothetical protein